MKQIAHIAQVCLHFEIVVRVAVSLLAQFQHHSLQTHHFKKKKEQVSLPIHLKLYLIQVKNVSLALFQEIYEIR